MALYIYILLFVSSWVHLEATIQKDILTYINDLRHLHSAGPLISSPTISALAQKSAERFKNGGSASALSSSQFNTNHCVFRGRLSRLAKTCVVSWYTTMKDHSWCKPERDGKARPFVNMLWNATTRAGIGVSQGKNGRYFVVAYFSPRKTNDVKENVNPVKIVTQASPKAVCPKGYSRFGSSCFKFHPEKATWEQAVIQCAIENATLTSVRNRKEEQFLRNLQEKGKGNEWMWIGLHDRLHEGQFVWLDGLDFAPGICAPVTTNGGMSQNCVAWTRNKPLSCWSDKLCSERHPFMCRMPIEGKLTYRVEILFKKYRWNPNFRNKLSKAFKDLKLGMKVTFKELFQRSSGRIGGGLRGIKIKAVRPFSTQGRRRGTAITLSLQFRSALADPTVKFQKFLRPSERVLSITVDSPDIHKSSLLKTQCSFPCRKHGQNSCPTWSNTGYPNTGYHNSGYHTGYHNMGYHTGYHNTGYHNGYQTGYQHNPCPTACTHYTYSCPTYCSQYCCSQGKQRKSSSSKAKPTNPPTQPTIVSTVAVNTGTAKTSAPATKAPTQVTQAPIQYQAQHTGYAPYQPYSQCSTCHLYSSPYCSTYCDEACCRHGNKEGDLREMLADMRENLKKFQAIVKLGKNSDLPGFEDAEFEGNNVPLFGNKAKLAVKTLKRNIEKLEAKIKRGEWNFSNKNNDFQAEEHKKRDNSLPYFNDDDDELSDLLDDVDGEFLELEEPKTKEDYPHMRVHSDGKSTQRKGDHSNTNMDNNEKAHVNEGFGERHPDSPQNIYKFTQTSRVNSEMYPENKSTRLSEKDFKEEEVGGRHPDSPPTIYENSFAHTQDTTAAEINSYPKIHPGNETTGATYHPDSPPTTYEQPFDHTQTTTANIHPQNESTGSSDFKYEERATYHPDIQSTTHEHSSDLTQTTTSAESYPRMHPDNQTTGSSDFKYEENATYHPGMPPTTSEHSSDLTQTTTSAESYPRMHPDNQTTGSSDFKYEENATYHPEMQPTTYEHSSDLTQTTTSAESYPRMHPDNQTAASSDFKYEKNATYHPEMPPTTSEHSSDLTQTTTSAESYPRMHPDNQTTGSSDFKYEENATYHPDRLPTTFEHFISPTQKTTADDKYVDPDASKETGTSFNVEGGASTFEEHTTHHPDSPPNTYEYSIDPTQTPIANDKYVGSDESKWAGTSSNIDGGATRDPDSPADIFNDYSQSLSTQNKTHVNK